MTKHKMTIESSRIGDRLKVTYRYRGVERVEYIDEPLSGFFDQLEQFGLSGEMHMLCAGRGWPEQEKKILKTMKSVYRLCRLCGKAEMDRVFDELYREYGAVISYVPE